MLCYVMLSYLILCYTIHFHDKFTLINLTYRQPFVSDHLKWRFVRQKQDWHLSQSEDWIYRLPLATRKCNGWHNLFSRMCRSTGRLLNVLSIRQLLCSRRDVTNTTFTSRFAAHTASVEGRVYQTCKYRCVPNTTNAHYLFFFIILIKLWVYIR